MTASVLRQDFRVYALEAKYECLKQIRLPVYLVFTLGFPVMFYLFFGSLFGRYTADGGAPFAAYYIATFGAFNIITTSLFGFGIGIATERGLGWMLLKRATPMPPLAYFAAKLFVSLMSATVMVLILSALGITVMGVHLAPGVWLRLFTTLVLGAIPFCSMGLALGYLAGPNSAPAVANFINFPMAIASGLWMPIDFLPPAIRRIGQFMPAYHYGQLALTTIGANRPGSVLVHIAVLTGFTFLCLALAYGGYRRDEDQTYG